MTRKQFEKLSNKKCGIGKRKQAISVLPIPIESDDKLFTYFTCMLPMPPTSNNLFPSSARGRFKSKSYREWIALAEITAAAQQWNMTLRGPIRAKYTLHFSDKRRRDVANFEKAVTDFLVAQNVLEDDCQIDEFHLVRGENVESAYVDVYLESRK